MDKRNIGRFCIQFNISDARHLQVIEILEAQGRRKAQYIVEAVLRGADGTEASHIISDPVLLKSMVIMFVKEYLQKASAKTSSPAHEKIFESELNENIQDLTVDIDSGEVDSELLSAIKDSLLSFRERN